MTWREAKQKGLYRCCAMFRSGKRCSRVAVALYKFDWCPKHGPIMDAAIKSSLDAVRKQKKQDDED